MGNMIEADKIKEIAERFMEGSDLFVVDVKVTAGNDVELTVDSDTAVSIDTCAELSRAVEEAFDREQEDFSLMVASAGVGQPLKVFRQYKKLIGKPVEVVLKEGIKILAELRDATPSSLTLAYSEKVAVEGKKKKVEVENVKTYPLDEIKSTKEYLDFK